MWAQVVPAADPASKTVSALPLTELEHHTEKDENNEKEGEISMVHKGRVTIAKSGQLWVVRIGGRDAGYGRTKTIAKAKANDIRKAQGKQPR